MLKGTQQPATSAPDTDGWIKSTCPYCGVGCGIEARVEDGHMLVRGDQSHPANYGRLCSKGLALGETVINDGRLLEPSINGEPVPWDTALDHVAKAFQDSIRRHGPDSVALYVSGQLLTEDYYVANKLVKGYIGTGNIDTNSRLCMSSSVAGHKRAFGSDTVPNCYQDFEQADMVVLVGSNLAWCHPVLYQRLKAAKQQRPELSIVVVDPRVTDSVELADLHLAIQPGTDVALFNGLLNYLAENDYLNHAYTEQHTRGLADALASARQDTGKDGADFTLISTVTGVPVEHLQRFYKHFATTEKVLTVYSQGVNQSSAGVDKVNSIINCHLCTGRIGKIGSGPFSVTGQPNAMGGREVGGLANMLAAHMEFGNKEHQQIVKAFWQVDTIAEKPGLKAVDLFDAVDAGKIKVIWIMATNPVVSMPDADKVKRALEKCPLVVVSDCIADTDTVRCADIVLPAMGWAEKSGTVTNSERRISRQRQLIASSGQAKADWWIICQVALRMGYAGFNFNAAADVFREYAQMTGFHNQGRRDLDISPLAKLTNDGYDQLAPQQWPIKQQPVKTQLSPAVDQMPEQKRFFAEGQFYTANGKANLVPVSYRPPMTQASRQYPMALNTGRIRDQWHTMTRTGLAPKLGAHKPEPYVQINPQDARSFQLQNGAIAQLNSKWGQAKARVVITADIKPGQLFMPMHWTAVDSSEGRVCTLISPDVDPISGQPESKFTPVAIQPWVYQEQAILISRDAIAVSKFDYWVKRKIEGGFCYYLANHQDKPLLVQHLKSLPAFTKKGECIAFENKNNGSYRAANMLNGELLGAYIVARASNASPLDASQYAWLDTLLARELSTDIQRSILSGQAADSLVSGKQICACKQVGEYTIRDAIQQQACNSVAAVSACTQAGTGCGSCVPEIKQLIGMYAERDLT
ncbi:MAG: molybdopterin-dependent oxidoreductase, partial [Pseudomonadota bacterium]